ncbi:hypothetical protein BV378_35235 [Nostoc sp. RF31YmG]|nr:hypothetical protein BV378_35235 [Nostoc sp. RF31YmG]
MPKISQQNWRLRISNIFSTIIGNIFSRLIPGLLFLPVLAILYYFYWTLWIGLPIEVACQKVKYTQINCTLKYQALLQTSKQEIQNVKGMDIDTRISSSENGTTTDYVAVLRSENGNRDIKSYSNRNNPELELLNRRLNEFIKNSEEKLILTIRYTWLDTLIISFFAFVILLIFVVFILNSITQLFN